MDCAEGRRARVCGERPSGPSSPAPRQLGLGDADPPPAGPWATLRPWDPGPRGRSVKTSRLRPSIPNWSAQDGDGGGEGTGKDERRWEAEKRCAAQTGVTSKSHGIEGRAAGRDRRALKARPVPLSLAPAAAASGAVVSPSNAAGRGWRLLLITGGEG